MRSDLRRKDGKVTSVTAVARVALLLLIAFACPVAAATSQQLTPDQIKAMFATGKPFTSVSTSGEVFVLTFKPDGTALETQKGKKKTNAGTWRVSAKGYCTTWVSGRERCYTVRRNGTKYNVRDAVGQLISTWTP
jgi:hypothetical protein